MTYGEPINILFFLFRENNKDNAGKRCEWQKNAWTDEGNSKVLGCCESNMDEGEREDE